MAKSKKEKKREYLYWNLVSHLNDSRTNNGGFFDCGEDGILYVAWNGIKWEGRWIEIKKYPEVKEYYKLGELK